VVKKIRVPLEKRWNQNEMSIVFVWLFFTISLILIHLAYHSFTSLSLPVTAKEREYYIPCLTSLYCDSHLSFLLLVWKLPASSMKQLRFNILTMVNEYSLKTRLKLWCNDCCLWLIFGKCQVQIQVWDLLS
jgi:hypothetical protein